MATAATTRMPKIRLRVINQFSRQDQSAVPRPGLSRPSPVMHLPGAAQSWPGVVTLGNRRFPSDLAMRHDANSRRVFRRGIGRFLAIAGVVSKFAYGGRSTRISLPDRPASL